MHQRVIEWQTKIERDVGRHQTDLTVQTSQQNNLVKMWKWKLPQPLQPSALQWTSEQNLRVNLHFCTWHLATCVSSFFVAVLLCTLVSGQWERQTRLVLLRSRLARCCFVNSKKMFASLRGHPIRKKFEIYEPPSPSATFPISNYRADW